LKIYTIITRLLSIGKEKTFLKHQGFVGAGLAPAIANQASRALQMRATARVAPSTQIKAAAFNDI